MTTTAKDLTKEAAASPAKRVGDYVILARMTDKARAEFLGGNVGEYHTDCPLDHMLLDWKDVPYSEIKAQILNGATDEQIAEYLDSHGTPKTKEEVRAWSAEMDAMSFYNRPEKREWFVEECAKLGLDGSKTTSFQWLEADDATIGK